MPVFAHRNGRVSREVASETQFDPSVFLMGGQISAVAVAHALLCLRKKKRPRLECLLSLTTAFAHHNDLVSREITSETQLDPSVLLTGSRISAAAVAHTFFVAEGSITALCGGVWQAGRPPRSPLVAAGAKRPVAFAGPGDGPTTTEEKAR
jgi:hypothetical protein